MKFIGPNSKRLLKKARKQHTLHPSFKKLLKERNAAKRIATHRANQIANKTGLEKKFQEILLFLGVRFIFQYGIGKKLYDFYLQDFNIAIEVDGNYFHAHPDTHPVKYAHQKRTIKNDKAKNKICEQKKIQLIRYWESDVNDNKEWVINDLKEKLSL